MIEPLAHSGPPKRIDEKVEGALTLVLLSLPGYGFSPAPAAPVGLRVIARLWSHIATREFGFVSEICNRPTGAVSGRAGRVFPKTHGPPPCAPRFRGTRGNSAAPPSDNGAQHRPLQWTGGFPRTVQCALHLCSGAAGLIVLSLLAAAASSVLPAVFLALFAISMCLHVLVRGIDRRHDLPMAANNKRAGMANKAASSKRCQPV